MQFQHNQLPAQFAEEHGSDSAALDEKPVLGGPGAVTAGDDTDDDEDLDLKNVDGRVWLVKVSVGMHLRVNGGESTGWEKCQGVRLDVFKGMLHVTPPDASTSTHTDSSPQLFPTLHFLSTMELVQVPKFLMEKWSENQTEGGILGRMRVYDEKDSNGDPKIAVLLDAEGPKSEDSKETKPVPTEYKLTLQNTATKNMYVFGEKEEEDLDSGEEGHRKRRRLTSLLGTIHHECSLTPSLSSLHSDASYRALLRDRQRKAAEPRRTMKMLDVDQGTANRLASGMGLKGYKDRVVRDNFIKTKTPRTGPGSSTLRAARIPKNELLDLLFTHFSSAPYWTLKALTEHVKQPQVYLREVLGEIALLVPKGPYNGMWTLKKEFKGDDGGSRREEVVGASGASGSAKGKGKEVTGDDDDDEGEMEQVS